MSLNTWKRPTVWLSCVTFNDYMNESNESSLRNAKNRKQTLTKHSNPRLYSYSSLESPQNRKERVTMQHWRKKNSLCYAIPKYNGSKMHFGQPFSATLHLNELSSFKWNLCVYQTDFDILKSQVSSEPWLRANKRNDVYIPQPRCIDDLAFLPWGSRGLVRILAYLLIYSCTVFRSLAVFWECVPLYCILSCQITAARQGLESSTAAPVNRSCWSRLKREVFNAGIIFPSLWSNCPRSVPAIRAQF